MFIVTLFCVFTNFNAIVSPTIDSGDVPIQNRQTYTLNIWLNDTYYASTQTVQIFAEFLDDLSQPVINALCSFQIDDPDGNTTFFDTSYTNSSGIANTTYALPASATEGTWWVYVSADDGGSHQEYENTTFVVDDTNPITATITSPSGGAIVHQTISINANAADNAGGSGVDYVEFWLDSIGGTLIGTDSTAAYSVSWDTTTATDGSHNLYVRVYDNAGNYLDSAAVAVTVDNTNPITATITSPSGGAIVHQTISINANAADNAGGSGVDYVEFWLDSIGGTLIGTDSTAAYSVSWDTTTTTDGSHNLYVRVYDNAGNYLDSSPAVAVTVDNTNPITATITSPSSGADVRGTVSITANAADNVGGTGVDYVEFWLDSIGGTLIGSDATSPYSVSWDTTTTTDGAHNLYVRVYDLAGNYLDSSPAVSVTVDNTNPITATITSPSGGADVGGTISINANAADNAGGSGVNYVEFWLDAIGGGGTLIGSDSTSPYSVSWDTTTTTDGSHDLYVRVYDNAGNYLDSSPAVTVTVDNTAPITATITSPSAGADVGGTISINANAADNAGGSG
ncbi:MAG: Ig-like domain-containing protein, partial [Candidatus Helarchaeota archaeon]